MKITKLVVFDEGEVVSALAIDATLEKVEGVIHYLVEEQIIFVVPVSNIIKDWLITGHYRLARARYCATASCLGVPIVPLMDVFRLLNQAIESVGRCGSMTTDQKHKAFLRFGERLSAELFAGALARRRGGETVMVVDGLDFFGSHFGVSFEKKL